MPDDRKIVSKYLAENVRHMVREPAGNLKYPFVVPGAKDYINSLWDWDSWLTDIALRQILSDLHEDTGNLLAYEKGCILNFLDWQQEDGSIPMCISVDSMLPDFTEKKRTNIHKPCLIQHAAFIVQQSGGDAVWIVEYMPCFKAFLDWYRKTSFHEATGLYFWIDDLAIGVDNDPCTFYRPNGSSASVFLNCLMAKELDAYAYLAGLLGMTAEEEDGKAQAEALREACRKLLFDERNGFYYSADINLRPVDPKEWLHHGMPRHWDSVLQKIDVWSGILPIWAGIATKEQAERMVRENLLREDLFWAPYGIRTLSPKEQQYILAKSNNPSCWLGPVWGISNYLTFRALVLGGFDEEARELAERTIRLYGNDLTQTGVLHEYYDPDTGEGLYNPEFQNWNFLVANMISWLEGREMVTEF